MFMAVLDPPQGGRTVAEWNFHFLAKGCPGMAQGVYKQPRTAAVATMGCLGPIYTDFQKGIS